MNAILARTRVTHPTATAVAYEGTVTHRRHDPNRVFTPKLFLAYLDVDALPASLDSLPLWSARRVAPVRFRRRDFFDGGTQPLGDAVRDLVAERIGRRPEGQVFLLAHLRTFGWLFNPLSVYYCWTTDGRELDAIVLEVSNTPWGERHWYVFDGRDTWTGASTGARTAVSTPKELHVSPFLPMDVDYRVTWNTPGPVLQLRIDVQRAEHTIFQAELALKRIPLDARRAISLLTRHPLLPFRVSLGIHREAFRLFLRRVPRFRHPNRSRGSAS